MEWLGQIWIQKKWIQSAHGNTCLLPASLSFARVDKKHIYADIEKAKTVVITIPQLCRTNKNDYKRL